jgi:hypothetical protein
MHHSDAIAPRECGGVPQEYDVIARRLSADLSAVAQPAKAEAIQTIAAARVWIASLRSQ